MTPRERLLTALDHREPDRVPFDLGSTPVTGIHHLAYRELRAALGLPAREPVIWHMMQQLAYVEEDLHQVLQTDARGVRPRPPSSWKLRMTQDDEYLHYADEWGIVRRQARDRGRYFDLYRPPLQAAETLAEIDWYPWPSAVDEARFVGMRQAAEAFRGAGLPVVLGGICSGMMEMGQALRGYETYFTDLAANVRMVEAISDRILELKTEYWQEVLRRLGDVVDVVQEGDDYGAQHGLQISREMWRRLFKPRLASLFGCIKKAAPHVRILFHSCGGIRAIIPDLIEAGVDAVNPVQVSADGMATDALKRDFGRDLTYWGGVDTQHVLPFGSREEVAQETRLRIDHLAPGGGFVCAAVHNIQADVPAANVLEMWRTAREYGVY